MAGPLPRQLEGPQQGDHLTQVLHCLLYTSLRLAGVLAVDAHMTQLKAKHGLDGCLLYTSANKKKFQKEQVAKAAKVYEERKQLG